MKTFINWSEVSRELTQSRHIIRKDKAPVEYQGLVDELEKAVSSIISEHKNKLTGDLL